MAILCDISRQHNDVTSTLHVPIVKHAVEKSTEFDNKLTLDQNENIPPDQR